ncbi:GPI transamidase component PIG-T-like [Diabrotica undecimpunctata]|uniref:GPI transamidase component PIG-T-like n=1 Tax=Diabrotica undecimpunctata TaxID=50387 RepID=UPI003B638AD2
MSMLLSSNIVMAFVVIPSGPGALPSFATFIPYSTSARMMGGPDKFSVVTVNGKDIKSLHLRYIPARQRERPNYLEVLIRIPASAATSIVVNFDYVFLKWQEYTGITQHGTLISDSLNASRSGYLVRVRTENIVITLPTPNFSMPYNGISLACTVVALAFGPLHNIITRKLVFKSKKGASLVERVKGFVGKFKKEKSE